MLDTLIERIHAAHANHSPLILQGGGSKTFYGNADETLAANGFAPNRKPLERAKLRAAG